MDDYTSQHYEEFIEGAREARQEGEYDQTAFFQYATDRLREDGAANDPEPAYLHNSVYAIDGYDSSSFEQDQSLVFFVCDETVTVRMSEISDHVPHISRTEIYSYYQRLVKFISDSLTGIFPPEGFEDPDVVSVAQMICDHRNDVNRFRLYFLTDRLYKPQNAREPESSIDFSDTYGINGLDIDGKPYGLDVWDLNRWIKAERGEDDEHLTVDLTDYAPGGAPVVRAPQQFRGFDTYMLFFTGDELADLYERYGSKLMESNVRSFLSFRGKVNKGIRDTIEHHPQDFVAYNNGISATASAVGFATRADGGKDTGHILSIRDLQIVNGGQTTASIFNTRKKDKADLSQILVPAKVVVITDTHDTSQDFVPNIARFTNSQNKVSQTDLSSTSPYQMRLETLSRRVVAPKQRKTIYANRWYYERARGQYGVEKDRLFGTEEKRFNKENPRKQVIKLTDAVRYMLCWEQQPAVVSLGAQKSYTWFSKQMSVLSDADVQAIGEQYYRDLVCAKILYDTTRRFYMSSTTSPAWYKGYPGPVTTYAIAKIAHDLQVSVQTLDFERIWNEQALPSSLNATINVAGAEAMAILTESDRPTQNVTEWAKKPECWNQLLTKQGSCLQPSDAIIRAPLQPGHGQFLRIGRTPKHAAAVDAESEGFYD